MIMTTQLAAYINELNEDFNKPLKQNRTDRARIAEIGVELTQPEQLKDDLRAVINERYSVVSAAKKAEYDILLADDAALLEKAEYLKGEKVKQLNAAIEQRNGTMSKLNERIQASPERSPEEKSALAADTVAAINEV
ncbi:MAG: hypothetical protein KAS66_00230 [Candidatus Omnitrophica bacterium]|nr:hypothetical protein [Candidatus Omnitrophota bacterium]